MLMGLLFEMARRESRLRRSKIFLRMRAGHGIYHHWQKEKYTLIFQNSTWAFTVWDVDRMVAMVRVISDKIMAANIMDLVVLSEYKGRGIGRRLVELCVQKLPHGDWFTHTSAANFSFYEKCGFEVKDLNENGTCAYYGYIKAREEGHR